MQSDFDQSKFRDPALAQALIRRVRTIINEIADVSNGELGVSSRPVRLMEVCGTHTVSIFRSGLRSVFDSIDGLSLLSGPGCPVCVTPTSMIDAALEIAAKPGVVLATFGDMMKVRGSVKSLSELKAEGASVRVVHSPAELIPLAQDDTGKQIVFFSVGFETTTPGIAYTLKKAKALGIDNLSVVAANKLVPPALIALLQTPDFALHGFILPGHVSALIGTSPYEIVAEKYRTACMITGFEPINILNGVAMLLEQIRDRRAAVESAYKYAVPREGNAYARAVTNQVFEVADSDWRGIGAIPRSGLALNAQYRGFDSLERFGVAAGESSEPAGCRCGEVLTGRVAPSDCALFGQECNPENPIGACMVSSEGTCSAHFKYGGVL